MPPRSFAARNSLPPEGAAAPVARLSRFHGPCLNGEPPPLRTECRALPPEGAECRGSKPANAGSDGTKKGCVPQPEQHAAAPVARRSRFHGSCLNGRLNLV